MAFATEETILDASASRFAAGYLLSWLFMATIET